MSPGQEYWLNWSAQFAIAVGTIGAVVVALFGDPLRRRLYPPKLGVRLVRKPVQADYSIPKGDGTYTESTAWWYHVEVFNPRRWPAVSQVKLNLIEIEEVDPAGTLRSIWQGTAAIQWANADRYPLLRDIGHVAAADLCSVVKNDCLRIYPRESVSTIEPIWGTNTNLFLTFQATGIEADSNSFRVQIAWDGLWGSTEEQLARHLSVKEAPRARSIPPFN